MESQELKLRKLRALRGQPNPNIQQQQQQGQPPQQHVQQPHQNPSVTADLESIRSLFNEKEKELSMAVQKVEELTGIPNIVYKRLLKYRKNSIDEIFMVIVLLYCSSTGRFENWTNE